MTGEVLAEARRLRNEGNRVTPCAPRSKRAILPNWPDVELGPDELGLHFRDGNNLSQVCGVNEATDVDLDSPEAAHLAPLIVPPTRRRHGRPSAPNTHYWYRCPVLPKSAQFTDPDLTTDQAMIVEIRAAGCQTLVPGSWHPDGERIRWEQRGEPARVNGSAIESATRLLAALVLVVRTWPGRHSHVRHRAALALAGTLARRLDDEEQIANIVRGVAELAGDEEARDRAEAGRSTFRKQRDGEATTGLPELLSHLNASEARKRKIAAWFGQIEGASASPVSPPVPSLSPEMLPEGLRTWQEDIASRNCVPLEYGAAAALVSASAVVGCSVGIRPDRYSDRTLVPNLWGMVVAPPGSLKSPTIAEAQRPLRRLEADARKTFEEERNARAPDRRFLEAEIQGIQQRITQAAKQGNDDALAELRDLLALKEDELRETEVRERRYVARDATVEKLGELLRDNPRGLLLERDEAAGWLRSLDKAGREGDREFFLEAWDGTGDFRVDRITRGSIYVPALCLSILGSIQPGKLRRYLQDALGGGAGDDGLLQRLQLIVWPDKLPPWQAPARFPDAKAKDTAFAIFKALDELAPVDHGAMPPDEEDGIPYFSFSCAAQQDYDAWREELETRLRSDEMERTPALAAHLGKYRSLIPSLALLFHLIDCVDRNASGPVSLDALRLAMRWGRFLEGHAAKLYAGELSSTSAQAVRGPSLDVRILELLPGLRDCVKHGKLAVTEVTRALNAGRPHRVSDKTVGGRLRAMGFLEEGLTSDTSGAALLWDVGRINRVRSEHGLSPLSEGSELPEDSDLSDHGAAAPPSARASSVDPNREAGDEVGGRIATSSQPSERSESSERYETSASPVQTARTRAPPNLTSAGALCPKCVRMTVQVDFDGRRYCANCGAELTPMAPFDRGELHHDA